MNAIRRTARRIGSAAVTAVQIAALHDPDACDCGVRIPAGRIAYCSDRCRFADMDHGTDHTAEEAS